MIKYGGDINLLIIVIGAIIMVGGALLILCHYEEKQPEAK
ncbi:hypothetical protein A45J_1945 [hot springs metagenome]